MSRYSFLKRSLMKSHHFSLPIFLLALMSCTKDKDLSPAPVEQSPDTLRPSSTYFPAYPGSWWKYINTRGDTFKYFIEPAYRYDSYNYNAVPANLIAAYVPYYVTSGTPIGYMTTGSPVGVWGNLLHLSTRGSSPLFHIIDETRNEWPTGMAYNGGTYFARVLTQDTSVFVNGRLFEHVTKLGYFVRINLSNGPLYAWSWFAKDVGQIRMEDTDTLNLVDYFINK
jgi:hypothetical protein